MKEISGFEGYLVDEEGNIYSEKTGRFLSQSFTNGGYLKVGLTKDCLWIQMKICLVITRY